MIHEIIVIATTIFGILLILEFHLHNGYHLLRLTNWLKGVDK
jgi:hypothetical protein